ncbi:MAG: UDP-N-acetylglucosamine 2-epimerase (non-hydrolyzing) [Pseudomonadota bacterium]
MALKLTTILGARPQFVKASALSRRVAQLNAEGAAIEETIVHTGQHYDQGMSDVFFSELAIPQPTLRLAAAGDDRAGRFAAMVSGLGDFLGRARPDVVLVFGDTDTTLAGALTASQLGIPVAHVEAGLRSYNRTMPEETNRVLTDHISRFLFCPTTTAVANLAAEGIFEGRNVGEGRSVGDGRGADDARVLVSLCGDIQLETLRHYAAASRLAPGIREQVHGLTRGGPYALATIHRAESTADAHRLGQLLLGVKRVARRLPVIIPLHPGTRKKMDEHGLDLDDPRVLALPPVGFLDMIALLDGASLVMTDSGGLQKEAFFLRTPCLTLRRETEWVELVELGCNRVCGVEAEAIDRGAALMLEKACDWSAAPYGAGDTSLIVLETLSAAFTR